MLLPQASQGVASLYQSRVYAPAAGRTENPLAKFAIGGVVTVFFEMAAFGHFMEFLKISKQTSELSYLEIARRATASKGIVGTLDGFFPWGALQSMVKGAVFSFGQAATKKMFAAGDNYGMSDQAATVLSGGFGGFFQGVVMSPLLLLKTRVMTDSKFRTSGGMWATSVASARVGADIVAKEGAMTLMKGATVFSAKRFADWTTRFFFVEVVTEIIRGGDETKKLSTSQQIFAALAGGTISALTTIPIDVLVATVQDANKAGQKMSVVEIYKQKIAEGGLKGTFEFATRGTVARVAHVALTTLLMKTVSSKVYDLIMR
jgi:hypothetical protein